MAQIEIAALKKVYPGADRPTIENTNLTINDKEFVVLVGPSGCGKSTLLRMVAGLEEITDGELRIDDERMNEVLKMGRYLDATRTVLQRHGGLWFQDESFVVVRKG